MTAPFDWAGLWGEAYESWRLYGRPAAADYLRTRIEAAFVPNRTVELLGEAMEGLSARAEAAEAENARLAAQLTEARESERAAMTEVNGLKDALAQVPEFICRKCGRRQGGPTDNEARF